MEGQTKKEEREKENKMRWKEVEGEVITRNYKDIDSGNNSTQPQQQQQPQQHK